MAKGLIKNEYELDARYNIRASFCGKAHVQEMEDGSTILKSYWTEVAGITPEGKLWVNGRYSQTTGRHIREFMKQYGFYSQAKWTWDEILREFNPEREEVKEYV